jgi:hypothetical protein
VSTQIAEQVLTTVRLAPIASHSYMQIIAEELSKIHYIAYVPYPVMLIALASVEKPKRRNAHLWRAPLYRDIHRQNK